MKTFLNILFLIISVVCLAQTPSSNQNYIKTSTYREPTTSVDDSKAQVNVTYFDGIGRPVQMVSGKMSGEGKDIITHISYDGFGRKVLDFLPYAKETDNLSFDEEAEFNSFDFYNKPEFQNSSNPYSEMFIELSPLNRVIKQAAPGDKWKGDVSNNDNTIKYAYLLNSDNDAVKKLTAIAAWNPTTKIYDVTFNTNSGANYPEGALYKTITQNENKIGPVYTSTALASKVNTSEEYKNKEGQTVLKRTFNWVRGAPSPDILNTYYIYDQFGNLAFVSSPNANGSNSTINLNNHTYHYKYDSRNRLVEKKLPGKQWEYLVYDNQDRVVAVGPVLSPFGSTTALPEDTPEQGWLLTRYDIFGRVAYTGWLSTGLTGFSSTVRNTMQNSSVEIVQKKNPPLNIDNVPVSYTDVLPQTTKLLTVNYYDDYNFSGAPTTFPTVEGQTVITNCKGLATGSWVRALSSSSVIGETSYTFYDDKSRPIRTYTTNYLGGYTHIDSKLDFDGTVQYTVKRHKRLSTDGILTIREDFSYTPQDRLSGHSHKINSLAAQTLASFTYDKIGQLTQKRVGTMTGSFSGPLQYVDYKYNIRGWLTDINDIENLSVGGQMTDQFAFKVNYDSPEQGSTPLFNGNISETFWISRSDNILRKYVYQYDNLNRMTYAFYQKPNDAVINTNSYNETLTYDKNGNILTLRRNGGLDDPQTVVEIDNLSYLYNGNQLRTVFDASNSPQGFKDGNNAGDDFKYDGNGNMKIDANKGITSITYNFQNLPTEIVFDNDTSKKINYLYNANGIKLKKTVTDGTKVMVVDYLDGFQYKGNILQFFPTAEGYVDNTRVGGANNFSYVYQYKDHLGNVRMDYGFRPGRTQWDIGEIVIKEESHYYPFGLKHMNYNMDYLEYQDQGGDIVLAPPPITPSGKLANNYMYNGKELQDELGLNMYDYGARNYDPALGRWMNIDPLAETSRRWSPYTYCYNNPMRFVDPDGMRADDVFINSETQQVSVVKTNDNFDRIIIDGNYVGDTEKGWVKDWVSNNVEDPKINDVSITYSNSANPNTVSDYTTAVLVDAMNETGNTSITVTSTARTPEAQANAMATNVKAKGMASQKKLYAAAGDKVLDEYPDKKAMVNKINEIGPGKVSKHCADPTKMNVLDVSVWRGGIKNPKSFATEVENDSRVSKVLSPYNSTDPAIHIEVPQP